MKKIAPKIFEQELTDELRRQYYDMLVNEAAMIVERCEDFEAVMDGEANISYDIYKEFDNRLYLIKGTIYYENGLSTHVDEMYELEDGELGMLN